jgi:hypothetical protein
MIRRISVVPCRKIPVLRPCSRPRALPPQVDVVYFTGKTIILFTMFYCSLQWAHYRSLQDDKNEKKDQEDHDS